MKFSRTVQVNAVPEWSAYYISYSSLKRLIQNLEEEATSRSVHLHRDSESVSLLVPTHQGDAYADFDVIFQRALDDELKKIVKFYTEKEHELYGEVCVLEADIHAFTSRVGVDEEEGHSSSSSSSMMRHHQLSDAESMVTGLVHTGLTEDSIDKHSGDAMSLAEFRDNDGFDEVTDMKITLKKRAVSLYVALSELRSYVQLNRTGFAKALKKYTKLVGRELPGHYVLDVVEQTYPFLSPTRDILQEKISEITSLYAFIATRGDMNQAVLELRLHLREYIVWERSTLWREMVGIENKVQSTGITNQGLLSSAHPIEDALEHKTIFDQPPLLLRTRIGTMRLPRLIFNSTFLILSIIIAVFVVLLVVPIFDAPEPQACLAILIAASMLWASEVIPLFVTSMLVPLLIVVFRVARTEDEYHTRMSAPDATKYIFAAMWSPVIMLLLGGFAIAAALSKYNIAKVIATWVLSNAGTKPRNVVLTTMFVAMFLSMWISNVASPVLCLSIVQPLLRTQDTNSNFPKALILGIALASNIGGMASPIASPQNVIALQNMYPNPSWGAWFFIALPVCIFSIVLIWLMLLVTLNPNKGAIITKIERSTAKFDRTQIFVSAVTLITIALWCVSHQLEPIFGDMGVLAIIPLVVFFGTGLLTKEDFNNFMWTIIILAMGGIALGRAVSSSGLLDTIAMGIRAMVSGLGIYGVMVVFGSMILVIATFISHTVAALILLPIVAQVGNAMDGERHPNLLVMASAFLASCAMGLPTSGFPNVTAICTTDDQGRPYLTVKLFITRGVPASILAYIVIITLGFGLMKVVNL
ncbi:SPX domain-containing protein [Limtongia smithiae]|uniref:SPX domain-containing protein n=1 Tax=Limtongia smithiae TaxID=1125753 RepID=UPI0034D0182D